VSVRAALAALILLAACAPLQAEPQAAHPEARAYDKGADANTELDAALARAAASGKRTIVVMGANWCHDSRALAGWFETPRFRSLLAERYETVFVDVGEPQTGDWRNADIARRFGIDSQENTPMVIMVSPGGARENSIEDAKSWRNAASRSEDEIYDYLAVFPR